MKQDGRGRELIAIQNINEEDKKRVISKLDSRGCYEQYGIRLKNLRKELKINQTEMALYLNDFISENIVRIELPFSDKKECYAFKDTLEFFSYKKPAKYSNHILSRLETNTTQFLNEDLIIFSKIFNCSTDYLLGISNIRDKESVDDILNLTRFYKISFEELLAFCKLKQALDKGK